MKQRIRAVALAWGVLSMMTAFAAKVPLYDNFTRVPGDDGIDNTKWFESEGMRFIDPDKDKLLLNRAVLGGTASDSGVVYDTWGLSMTHSAPAKGLKATFTIGDIVTPSCATNTAVTFSRARLIGAYFNVRAGGPLPDDRTGDVLAQMRIGRRSDTSDAEGVLRVEGVVAQCTNADCTTSTLIGSVASFGTVSEETATTAQIDWDKKNNQFTFTRDAMAPIVVTYTLADGVAPSIPFNAVNLRQEVPNCAGGPRVKAFIEALVDNVGLAP